VTIAALPVDKQYAKEFGVIETTYGNRIVGFHEKNANAPTIPGDPSKVFASMGNYIFSTDMLLKLVEEDQKDPNSSHDFGKNILPKAIERCEMFAYDFMTNEIPGEPADKLPYWRDVGTLDAFFEANMDLRAISPELNLFNRDWPLRTAGYSDAPTKFAFDEDGRRGHAIDSVLSGGCIISGAMIKDSVIGRQVYVHAGAEITDSIVFDNCDIGRRSKLRHCIIEKNVKIAEDTVIGYNVEEDKQRFFVSDSGIVVVEGPRTPVELTKIIL
jgi:glucose-1-phosphate adenylyltransferase